MRGRPSIHPSLGRLTAVCVAVLSAATLASAQDGASFSPDRPGATQGTGIVATHQVYLESGAWVDVRANDGIDEWDLHAPDVLVRIGVARRWELRIAASDVPAEWARAHSPALPPGREDAAVGAKIRLLRGSRRGLTVSLIPMLSLPTGTGRRSAHLLLPNLTLAGSVDAGRGFALAANLDAALQSSEASRAVQTAATVDVSHGLGRAWGVYADASTHMSGADDTRTVMLESGVVRSLGARAQLDVEGGRAFHSTEGHWFAGVGFAARTGRRARSR